MHNTINMPHLTALRTELEAIEAETFEIHDHIADTEMAAAAAGTTSCTSTCSSCTSTSGTSCCG